MNAMARPWTVAAGVVASSYLSRDGNMDLPEGIRVLCQGGKAGLSPVVAGRLAGRWLGEYLINKQYANSGSFTATSCNYG